jgi:hypothetical protein
MKSLTIHFVRLFYFGLNSLALIKKAYSNSGKCLSLALHFSNPSVVKSRNTQGSLPRPTHSHTANSQALTTIK